MRYWRLLTLLLLGGAALCVRPAYAEEELRPIPAAAAEARVADLRDTLVDVLWIGIDGYWHEGQWEDCLRLNREIVALDPHFVEAYTSAAWLLWSEKRDKEAIAMYEQGLIANPDSGQLYWDFGFYYRDRKQYDQAVAMFRKAVEKGVTKTQQHMLPNTLEEAGRKREALAEWRQVLKRFPGDAIAKRKIAGLEKDLAK